MAADVLLFAYLWFYRSRPQEFDVRWVRHKNGSAVLFSNILKLFNAFPWPLGNQIRPPLQQSHWHSPVLSMAWPLLRWRCTSKEHLLNDHWLVGGCIQNTRVIQRTSPWRWLGNLAQWKSADVAAAVQLEEVSEPLCLSTWQWLFFFLRRSSPQALTVEPWWFPVCNKMFRTWTSYSPEVVWSEVVVRFSE